MRDGVRISLEMMGSWFLGSVSENDTVAMHFSLVHQPKFLLSSSQAVGPILRFKEGTEILGLAEK